MNCTYSEKTSVDPEKVYEVIARIISKRENVKVKIKLKKIENKSA